MRFLQRAVLHAGKKNVYALQEENQTDVTVNPIRGFIQFGMV